MLLAVKATTNKGNVSQNITRRHLENEIEKKGTFWITKAYLDQMFLIFLLNKTCIILSFNAQCLQLSNIANNNKK